jgi:hypothetical protein
MKLFKSQNKFLVNHHINFRYSFNILKNYVISINKHEITLFIFLERKSPILTLIHRIHSHLDYLKNESILILFIFI